MGKVEQRNEILMRSALDEARRGALEGNEPYGAVLCEGDRIIARGRNLVRTTHDVTAHSEVVALRTASAGLHRQSLAGLTLYTSYEPCPMCCGAVLASGVGELVVAASGYEGDHWGNYSVQALLALIGPSAHLRVTSGVLAEESRALVAAWESAR